MGWRLATAGVAAGCLQSAQAGTAKTNGQAVVCIYLLGGNDSNNMIVPLDQDSYYAYSQSRGALAIPIQDLLPLPAATGERSHGLHPSLGEIQRLYERRAASFVANVGAAAGGQTHLDTALGYLKGGFMTPGWAMGMAAEGATFTFSSGLSLVCASNPRIEGPELDNPELGRAIERYTERSAFPNGGLSLQLRQAASLIQAGPGLGMGRQVFLCTLAGFDTHRDQLAKHALLLRDVSQSMAAFYEAMADVGLAGAVTAYTDSEFSRTLQPNAQGGTEHGWGAHHIVLGGAVAGGKIFGRVAEIGETVARAGVSRPTTSREKYNRALAGWVGVGPKHAADPEFLS
jgi:uncharacterized protein (DUF1501 family)